MASSLNYVTISDEKSPILHPYPSWNANTLPDNAQHSEAVATGGSYLSECDICTRYSYMVENSG